MAETDDCQELFRVYKDCLNVCIRLAPNISFTFIWTVFFFFWGGLFPTRYYHNYTIGRPQRRQWRKDLKLKACLLTMVVAEWRGGEEEQKTLKAKGIDKMLAEARKNSGELDKEK